MREFVRPRRVADPALRFIGLHHAGGSASAYHPLSRGLPADWEVLLLDLPGRGKRRAEPLIRDMPRLLEGVVHDVAPYTDGPYVLFGHSMGAVVAIEVARRLSAARRPPAWVGISGRAAPRTHEAAALRLSDLADDRLSAVLLSLGGTPSRIREMPEFHAHFLRVARADLQALDSHRPDPGRVPLPCPLTAFGGIADPWAPPAGMPDWEHETSGEFRQCFFPGGHFYFLDSAFDPLSREICQEVRAALRATGYRPAARTA